MSDLTSTGQQSNSSHLRTELSKVFLEAGPTLATSSSGLPRPSRRGWPSRRNRVRVRVRCRNVLTRCDMRLILVVMIPSLGRRGLFQRGEQGEEQVQVKRREKLLEIH